MILSRAFKKALCTILVFASVFSLCVPAAYASDVSPYTSDYINSYGGYIEKSKTGALTVFLAIEAAHKMDSIGASSVAIQKKSGNTWTTVKRYSSSTDTHLMGSNRYTYSDGFSYSSVTSGGTYRAVVSFYVSSGTKSESRLFTSNTLTF